MHQPVVVPYFCPYSRHLVDVFPTGGCRHLSLSLLSYSTLGSRQSSLKPYSPPLLCRLHPADQYCLTPQDLRIDNLHDRVIVKSQHDLSLTYNYKGFCTKNRAL
ncbi:hypothetical protein DPEC_G00253040 [Dallia pectoralis]|uniref:Uncharacterized protein n=1 Tax=Dallia pectoralis TaxID=75939 RepID=A0ACC2FTZ8_DALPE|nr:hypothetical protein DPEC_G00253040 [Dallia pectoralis]